MTILTKSVRLVWQNPYVTNGLVAMWDGEWNVVGGNHTPDSTVWRDLTGNYPDMILQPGMTWGPNCLKSDGSHYLTCQGRFTDKHTWEYVKHTSNSCGAILMAQDIPTTMIVEWPGTLHWNGKAISSAVGQGLGRTISYAFTRKANGNMDLWSGGYRERKDLPTETVPAETRFTIGTKLSNTMSVDLYSIRFYDRVLTDAEIAANHAIDQMRFGSQ